MTYSITWYTRVRGVSCHARQQTSSVCSVFLSLITVYHLYQSPLPGCLFYLFLELCACLLYLCLSPVCLSFVSVSFVCVSVFCIYLLSVSLFLSVCLSFVGVSVFCICLLCVSVFCICLLIVCLLYLVCVCRSVCLSFISVFCICPLSVYLSSVSVFCPCVFSVCLLSVCLSLVTTCLLCMSVCLLVLHKSLVSCFLYSSGLYLPLFSVVTSVLGAELVSWMFRSFKIQDYFIISSEEWTQDNLYLHHNLKKCTHTDCISKLLENLLQLHNIKYRRKTHNEPSHYKA